MFLVCGFKEAKPSHRVWGGGRVGLKKDEPPIPWKGTKRMRFGDECNS